MNFTRCTPVIPAFGKLKHGNFKSKTSLSNILRPCVKNKKQNKVFWAEPLATLCLQGLSESIKETSKIQREIYSIGPSWEEEYKGVH